jgi:hypothetical protein
VGAGPKASRTWSSSLWTRGTVGLGCVVSFFNLLMIMLESI